MTISPEGCNESTVQNSNSAGCVYGNLVNNNYGSDETIIIKKISEFLKGSFTGATDEIIKKLTSVFRQCLKSKQPICCKNCNKKVAKSVDIILSMPVDTIHCLLDKWKNEVCNVEDVLFQKVLNIQERICTFFCCDFANVTTTPEVYKGTFYHDYDGRIALCPDCKEQVGWVFDLKDEQQTSNKKRKFVALFPEKNRY